MSSLARHGQPQGRVNLRRVGAWLRVLVGVDEQLLAKVPSERARYTALGGTVLGTASIAAFSMAMALAQVLGGFAVFLLLPALIWGLFVLNLDRWLVASSAGSRWHRRAAILLPRVALAVFFGIVIAEPLVMRVFQTAIEQHIRTERQQELTNLGSLLLRCNPEPSATEQYRAAVESPECENNLLPFAESAQATAVELAAKRTQAERLQQTIEGDARQLAALEDLARRECAGTAGPGLTGARGRGPECLRREREADDFRTSHRIEESNKQLAELRDEIGELQSQVSAAQTNYQNGLEAEIASQVDKRAASHGPIGLLERFRAMHELISVNSFLTIATWCVRMLFIVVDCLPVLVKFFGGTTGYDRLVDVRLASAQRVHQETVRTNEVVVTADLEVQQHRAEAHKQQRRAEIDLQTREHEAGIHARIDQATDLLTDRLASRQQREASNNHYVP
jgi:Domain of unknown function (DUF4407)